MPKTLDEMHKAYEKRQQEYHQEYTHYIDLKKIAMATDILSRKFATAVYAYECDIISHQEYELMTEFIIDCRLMLIRLENDILTKLTNI